MFLQAQGDTADRIAATLGPGRSDAAQQHLRIAYPDAARGRPAMSSVTSLDAWANPLALWRATPKPRTIRLPDVTEWEAAITAYLGAHPETDVVIWSWSDHLASQTVDTVAAYLEVMSSLESGRPAVRFVYVTGHLGDDRSGSESAEGNDEDPAVLPPERQARCPRRRGTC